MTKQLIEILLMFSLLTACSHQPDNKVIPDLSNAVIRASSKNVNLIINTSSISSGHPAQTIVFTNIGQQPATNFTLKKFNDESAPLDIINNCDKDLAAGGNCSIKIKLNTNYKLASSGPVSRSTILRYEYNNSKEIITDKLDVRFTVERWIASIFLTGSSSSGNIAYRLPEELPAIKTGTVSADYYCQVDKNNPHNGYTYYALIYNTVNRTPYLNWVLVGGKTYFSVMPNVYHQKVWQTSYKQATAADLISQVYNCIGKDCINQKAGDEAAWVGLQLNDNSLDTNTCGSAGNAWKSDTNQVYGKDFALKPNIHYITRLNADASCDIQKKIICVSI